MVVSSSALRSKIDKIKGQREYIEKEKEDMVAKKAELETRYEKLEAAQVIIQNVATLTQEKLSYHVSELVTLALQTVFPDPYDFVVDFVLKRGKTEADMFFERRDMRADPLTASGGGAVDVAAFALRVSLWSLRHKKSRPVMVLDEPFRFVSVDLQDKASALLKEISDRLGIQFIIVTHEDELKKHADRVFQVSIKKGKSKIQIA